MQTLLALQSDEPTQTAASSSPSVEDRFLEEAHKSPIQRLREQILDSLGLTEDQLNALPADQRRAIEDKITKIIREKIREAAGADPNTQQSDGASEAVSALQDFA